MRPAGFVRWSAPRWRRTPPAARLSWRASRPPRRARADEDRLDGPSRAANERTALRRVRPQSGETEALPRARFTNRGHHGPPFARAQRSSCPARVRGVAGRQVAANVLTPGYPRLPGRERLERLTKTLGASIVVSAAILARAPSAANAAPWLWKHDAELQGRSGLVSVAYLSRVRSPPMRIAEATCPFDGITRQAAKSPPMA